MNNFTPSRYSESLRKGALGVELWDHHRLQRLQHAVDVSVDGPPPVVPNWLYAQSSGKILPKDLLPRLYSRRTYMYALFYKQGSVAETADIRVFDATREFVPRRLQFTIPSLAAAESSAPSSRISVVGLFPAAAYSVPSGATGLRGRVERDGKPLRWARVEARIGGGAGTVVGRAHGDDRGEFLLILAPRAGGVGDLPALLSVNVTVYARPAAATPDVSENDPLGDMEIEVVSGAAVAWGDVIPANYTAKVTRVVKLAFAAIRSDELPFVFT